MNFRKSFESSKIPSVKHTLASRHISQVELLRKNQELARENSILKLKAKTRENYQQQSSEVSLGMTQASIRAIHTYLDVTLRNDLFQMLNQQINLVLDNFRSMIQDLPHSGFSNALTDTYDPNQHYFILDEEQRSLHRQSSLEQISTKVGQSHKLSTIAEMSLVGDVQVTESRTTTLRRTFSVGRLSTESKSIDVPRNDDISSQNYEHQVETTVTKGRKGAKSSKQTTTNKIQEKAEKAEKATKAKARYTAKASTPKSKSTEDYLESENVPFATEEKEKAKGPSKSSKKTANAATSQTKSTKNAPKHLERDNVPLVTVETEPEPQKLPVKSSKKTSTAKNENSSKTTATATTKGKKKKASALQIDSTEDEEAFKSFSGSKNNILQPLQEQVPNSRRPLRQRKGVDYRE